MCLANFSMVITSEYWDTAKAFFFSVFTRLRSALSGFLPSPFCLVDTWFSLIDSKEVTVHWAHGNTVVNHTFVCFDGWYFNSPEAPFLALLWVVIDVWRLTSNKTRMCRLWRPIFGTREAFFRLLVQRYNNLELKTNFSATDFLGTSVSVWLIVLYNDVSEINCCILTDFEENEGLWLRILEKRS